jgi:hypothetical protein
MKSDHRRKDVTIKHLGKEGTVIFRVLFGTNSLEEGAKCDAFPW